MEPRERLPELTRHDSSNGARLKVTLKERGIEIDGNRKGLNALAAICSGLAELPAEDLRTPANDYHLDEDFWGIERGSVPLTVYCHQDAWPGA